MASPLICRICWCPHDPCRRRPRPLPGARRLPTPRRCFFCSRPHVQLCAQPSTPLSGFPGACASVLATRGAAGSLLLYGNTYTGRAGRTAPTALFGPFCPPRTRQPATRACNGLPQPVVPPPAAATARSGRTTRLTAIGGVHRDAAQLSVWPLWRAPRAGALAARTARLPDSNPRTCLVGGPCPTPGVFKRSFPQAYPRVFDSGIYPNA